MNTNGEAWRDITLPVRWNGKEFAVGYSNTYKQYKSYFERKGICYQFNEGDNKIFTNIVFKIYCTEEELLVIRLSL